MNSPRARWPTTTGQPSPGMLDYVSLAAGPAALAEAVARAESSIGAESRRLHYLSVPPNAALSAVRMLGDAGLVQNSRIIMEKPFGTDLASAVATQRQAARSVRRRADLSHRPFPRQGAGAEHPRVPFRQRLVRAHLESQLHRSRADRCAGDTRASANARRSTSRPAPIATWWSRTCSRSWGSWPWSRRRISRRKPISEEKNKVFRSMLPIQPDRRGARAVHRLSRRGGRGARVRHRNLHRAQVFDRQLALGRRAVLSAHRQAAGRGPAHHLHRVSRAAQEHVSRRVGHRRAWAGPSHLRSRGCGQDFAVVLRQASGARHAARQAQPAVRHERHRPDR